MKNLELKHFHCVFALFALLLLPYGAFARHGQPDERHCFYIVISDSASLQPVREVYAVIGNDAYCSSDNGIIKMDRKDSYAHHLIHLHCTGYRSVLLKSDECFRKDTIAVNMSPLGTQLKEVVIAGRHAHKKLNAVTEHIGKETWDESIGTSLTALLEKVKGVSSIRTGTTVAKPVIHGMSGHRILLVANGARLAGQQWGMDHAPEVDMNNYKDIVVVKGSDAVRYGSDALGGIIVMNSATLPYQGNVLSGSTTLSYGTNGRKAMSSTTLQGAFPFAKRLAWRLQGTYGNSGDRSTANYVLNNTGTREYNASAHLGYKNESLCIEGGYNRYFNRIGIMLSAQMGSEDMLKERIELGRPVYVEPYSRNVRVPYQEVVHQTAQFKANCHFGGIGNLEWQGTWQQNDREEYNNRRLDNAVPTVSLHLQSLQNKLQWNKISGAWNYQAGAMLDYKENHSRAGTGFVPIIPNYTETQMGLFGLLEYNRTLYGLEAGIRYDAQQTRAKGYDWTGEQYGGKRNFQNITYSLGGHYRPNQHWTFTSNFGVAWRAPHVFELYSNGNDLASGMFVKGDSLMSSERSYKWITAVEFRHPYFSMSLDGFLQRIDGYIYDEPTKEMVTVISGAYPVFRYRQTPAFFRGVDFNIGIHPVDFLDYHVTGSYIAAEERHTGNYLPYIPSLRLRQELSYSGNWKNVHLSATLAHRYVAQQQRFNPETDLIAYTPPAYHLFDAYAQVTFRLKRQNSIKFTVAAENLLNKEYKEYTNRSRYYAHDMGRDIRLSGTWTF